MGIYEEKKDVLDYQICMELHKMGFENFYVPLDVYHWVVTGKNRVLSFLPAHLIPKDTYKFPAYDLADLLEFVSQLKSFLASKDVFLEVNIDLTSRTIGWYMGETLMSVEFPIATIGCDFINDFRDGLGLAIVGMFKQSQIVWVEEFLLEPKLTAIVSKPDLADRFFAKIYNICKTKEMEARFKDKDIAKIYEGYLMEMEKE